ncbi:putative E3 ubiquitin-protein ligase MARCH [Arabidopsis thaliana]|uniref:SHA1 n=2 Tax=Arabidopsis TaxID=3701 RepID=A0A178UNJ4_ARATH|nr:Zinc finger RING-CH-type [Arabidopsis thaliana x Arabidopsis arenosa]OAO95388.1 SHA1 [Arabidopsis thaliana]
MGKENQLETTNCGVNDHDCPPVKNEELAAEARYSTDSDSGLPTCRVCHSTESDRRGDTALGFLGITPPVPEARKSNVDGTADDVSKATESELKNSDVKSNGRESGFIELTSPDAEVFICTNDIEMGIQQHQDALLELGCSCKNELALVHYACALKWFLNHGSTVCEICGHPAENIKTADFNKVVIALRDYTAIRERTADGGDQIPVLPVNTDSTIDSDEVAVIRRQRLSEITSWFGPHSLNNNNNNNSSVAAIPDQPLGVVNFDILPMENRATKWAVEGTGILLATGLLTVTLVWLIAPRVGKKTARSGLHILLGGLCALTIVIFFRFVVLTRIRYGPARYWAILFIFWFLVFGIWASRSNASHNSP